MVAVMTGILVLTGCAADPGSDETAENQARSFANTEPALEASDTDPTAPGEVCDPSNANDAICAAFHPEQAAKNMLARQKEPIASMSVEEQDALIQQACDAMESGKTWETAILVEEPNLDERAGYAVTNQGLFAIASYSQCQEHVAQVSPYGDWLINYYKGIGEAAAKDEFADGSMPDSIPDDLKPGSQRVE